MRIHYCALLNCYTCRYYFFVCNSRVAPTFSFEWTTEVLDLCNCDTDRLLNYALPCHDKNFSYTGCWSHPSLLHFQDKIIFFLAFLTRKQKCLFLLANLLCGHRTVTNSTSPASSSASVVNFAPTEKCVDLLAKSCSRARVRAWTRVEEMFHN